MVFPGSILLWRRNTEAARFGQRDVSNSGVEWSTSRIRSCLINILGDQIPTSEILLTSPWPLAHHQTKTSNFCIPAIQDFPLRNIHARLSPFRHAFVPLPPNAPRSNSRPPTAAPADTATAGPSAAPDGPHVDRVGSERGDRGPRARPDEDVPRPPTVPRWRSSSPVTWSTCAASWPKP